MSLLQFWAFVGLVAFLMTMSAARSPARGTVLLIFALAMALEYYLRSHQTVPLLSFLLPYVPNYELVEINRQMAVFLSQVYVQFVQARQDVSKAASMVNVPMGQTFQGQVDLFILEQLAKLSTQHPEELSKIKAWQDKIQGASLHVPAPALPGAAPDAPKASKFQKLLMGLIGAVSLLSLLGSFTTPPAGPAQPR